MDMEMIRSVVEMKRFEGEKNKGSRFIAWVIPASGMKLALGEVQRLREQFPDATHHCWAWRGDHEDLFRYSDDGEPVGSAGRPILNAMIGRRLVNIVVVVVRYYGGTKRGTGGLVRAYGGAAAAALEQSVVVETPLMAGVRVECAYDKVGGIQALLKTFEGAELRSDYGVKVALQLEVPKGQEQEFIRAARDLCSGQLEVEEVDASASGEV